MRIGSIYLKYDPIQSEGVEIYATCSDWLLNIEPFTQDVRVQLTGYKNYYYCTRHCQIVGDMFYVDDNIDRCRKKSKSRKPRKPNKHDGPKRVALMELVQMNNAAYGDCDITNDDMEKWTPIGRSIMYGTQNASRIGRIQNSDLKIYI